MRRWLGPVLARHVMSVASTLWLRCREGELSSGQLSSEICSWVALIEADCDGLSGNHLDLGRVMTRIRRGDTQKAAEQWLDQAAVAHLIGWRIDGYLRVEVEPIDRELPGGGEATQWVLDRFWHVFPEDWTVTSVLWELAFINEPAEVSDRAGVPREVLDERVISAEALTRASARRVWQGAPERVDGQTRVEMLETVIGHLESGSIELAAALARRWAQAAPTDLHAQLTLAFCLIPLNADEAHQQLRQISERNLAGAGSADRVPSDALLDALTQLNLASIFLMDRLQPRGVALAKNVIGLVDLQQLGDMSEEAVYLWLPWDMARGPQYMTIQEWLAELEKSGLLQDLGGDRDRQDQVQPIDR